jgi:hypothetical protein
MKVCPNCNLHYSDEMNQCTSCRGALSVLNVNSTQRTQQPQTRSVQNQRPNFETTNGRSVVLEGTVTEVLRQQLYQSRLTKILRAIFSFEPYQLSHTSFITLIRVEERVAYGYPERSRDVTVYGNIQNVITSGDDVTINAVRRSNRLVSRRIYNHSTESLVRGEMNISPMVFYVIFGLMAYLLFSLFNADYSGLGVMFQQILTEVIKIAFIGYILFYLLKVFFKGGK